VPSEVLLASLADGEDCDVGKGSAEERVSADVRMVRDFLRSARRAEAMS
jgi:hypothetical protein